MLTFSHWQHVVVKTVMFIILVSCLQLSTAEADGNDISFEGVSSQTKGLAPLKDYPDDGARGKVKRLMVKSLQLILWAMCISVTDFIPQIAV